jgi:hypothetical protein
MAGLRQKFCAELVCAQKHSDLRKARDPRRKNLISALLRMGVARFAQSAAHAKNSLPFVMYSLIDRRTQIDDSRTRDH